jgi:hypothetical protein
MPYEYDENEELVWIDPPPTEQELRIKEFAKQIQTVAVPDAHSSHDEDMQTQMKMLDLMFRSLVTAGTIRNNLDIYQAAIRTQTAYRRTWATLNLAQGKDKFLPFAPPCASLPKDKS